jgi:hypothetical protein
MISPSEPTRTFAEWEAFLDAMPLCSLKYRLLDALYSGRLDVAPPRAEQA